MKNLKCPKCKIIYMNLKIKVCPVCGTKLKKLKK
jgi:rRNA maturation endonuclease Nob1